VDDLSPCLLRPRVRAGLTAHPGDVTGRHGETILELPGGRYFLAGPREARILALMDGTRTLEELSRAIETTRKEAAETSTKRFVRQLSGLGLLEGLQPTSRSNENRLRCVPIVDPTPVLVPLCRLARKIPFPIIALGLAGLAGVAAFQTSAYGDRMWRLWIDWTLSANLPAALALVWFLGVVHELAHAAATVLAGGRVRSIGLTIVGWRFAFYADVRDAVLLRRPARMWIMAAGPLADAVVAVGALVAGRLLPQVQEGSTIVAAAAALRAGWNLVPVLRTDGYHLLSEVVRRPGLDRRARSALIDWLRTRLWRGRAGTPASTDRFLLWYGAFALAAEASIILALAALIARGVVRAWNV